MGAVSKALGMSGEQGEYYSPSNYFANRQQQLDQVTRDQNTGLSSGMQKLRQGGNVGDVVSSIQQGGGTPDEQQRMMEYVANDPVLGSQLAQQQVQQGALTGQMFGKGGAYERAVGEEKDLSSQPFQLQPQDIEKYGIESGGIARQFGQQEQDVAQQLAARGLAGSTSGAAIQQYAGLGGNKNEQLAALQNQVAQQAFNRRMQTLQSTRQWLGQLGQQAGNETQAQFGRQMAGGEANRANQQLGIQSESAKNQAGLAAMQQKIGQKGTTFGEAFGSGLMTSANKAGSKMGDSVMGGGGGKQGGGGGGGKMGGGGGAGG